MTYRITPLIMAAAVGSALATAPQFDRVYGSHMVLPHGKNVPVTGTAEAGKPVSVSFGAATLKTMADKDGKWSVTLPPMKPNATGQALSAAQGSDTTTLQDVLVGEVWVASGQSNMLWRLNQTTTEKEDIAASGDNLLRFLNNKPQAQTHNAHFTDKDFDNVTKDKFYKGEWKVSSPKTSPEMSAVGYYFGKGLREKLNIPVGIIHSSLGGSEIAAWIPQKVINSDDKLKSLRGNDWLNSPMVSEWVRGRAKKNITPRLSQGSPAHPYKPGFLYESGISWLTQLPVTGVLWYQGESDAEIINNEQNSMLLRTFIESWRKEFGNPALNFVMIQLPRINDKSALRRGWPEFREMQDLMSKTLPRVYCVNTIDLGSTNADVHPPFKRPVGERAAATALNKVYKKKTPCDGPTFKRLKQEKNKLHIQLSHAKGLKTTDGKAPAMFEVAGADKQFHPATATITLRNGDYAVISLSSDKVAQPIYARYCWNFYVTPNLVNEHDLPAKAFRSDAPEPVKAN